MNLKRRDVILTLAALAAFLQTGKRVKAELMEDTEVPIKLGKDAVKYTECDDCKLDPFIHEVVLDLTEMDRGITVKLGKEEIRLLPADIMTALRS